MIYILADSIRFILSVLFFERIKDPCRNKGLITTSAYVKKIIYPTTLLYPGYPGPAGKWRHLHFLYLLKSPN